MMTLKEYIAENEITDGITPGQAFEAGKRLVAREIAFMFGICIDHDNEDIFLDGISRALGE